MLSNEELEANYNLINDGLEAAKLVEDPIVRERLITGFTAMYVVLKDNMDREEKLLEINDRYKDIINMTPVLRAL